jgi:hypothetical protein
MDLPALSDFELELLELCSVSPNMGETTTTLEEEMLTEAYDRQLIEASLRSLVDRGLVTVSRGIFAGVQRLRDGRVVHRAYEDDWWVVTDEGRAAIGLPPSSGSDDFRWE